MLNNKDICEIVYTMLQQGDDSCVLKMNLSDQRFGVDIEVNILRVEDRKRNKEVFMNNIRKHCDSREDAAKRAH